MHSRGQQRGRRKKFTSSASTSARKTCRPSSGLRTTQRELCSTSAASTALRASTSGPTSVTTPSSSVSRAEELQITKRGRRTGRRSRQSFRWSWTRSAEADWKPVLRSSAFTATKLCLQPKCRKNWTRRACRTFLWSKRIQPHFHRKWRMSSSNWLLSVGDSKAVSWQCLASFEVNLNSEIKYYFWRW